MEEESKNYGTFYGLLAAGYALELFITQGVYRDMCYPYWAFVVLAVLAPCAFVLILLAPRRRRREVYGVYGEKPDGLLRQMAPWLSGVLLCSVLGSLWMLENEPGMVVKNRDNICRVGGYCDKPANYGECFWSDGTYYKGTWQRADGIHPGWVLTGVGTVQTQDGYRYEGRMKRKRPYGKGKLYYLGKLQYDGGWRNGEKHGEGIAYLYLNHGRVKVERGVWRTGKMVRRYAWKKGPSVVKPVANVTRAEQPIRVIKPKNPWRRR